MEPHLTVTYNDPSHTVEAVATDRGLGRGVPFVDAVEVVQITCGSCGAVTLWKLYR
jgi:hypothetical protein